MGEFFGREKWNSKTQIWGQSEGIHNPGHDFGLSRSFFPRLWTKGISLRWLHICWKVDEKCLFTISYLMIFILQGSPFTALVSQNLELMTNSFCFKPTQLLAIPGTGVSNGVGVRLFSTGNISSLGWEINWSSSALCGDQINGNISISNAFKLDDQHSHTLENQQISGVAVIKIKLLGDEH